MRKFHNDLEKINSNHYCPGKTFIGKEIASRFVLCCRNDSNKQVQVLKAEEKQSTLDAD